jgi:hypothetical protein
LGDEKSAGDAHRIRKFRDWSVEAMSALQTNDPAVWQALQNEEKRQRDGLELIASENYTSAAVI